MTLTVRPVAPDDKAAMVKAFQKLSKETVYRRFLAPVKRLTESELAYLTELDHADHEALIALTDAGEIVGVARYVRAEGDPFSAEAAVTVPDAWQRRGVGTALLRRLADRARRNGIERFTGVCLISNREMLQLFDELGPTTARHPDTPGTIEVEVTLPTDADESVHDALRAAASARQRG